jgi:AcrR family transcriptional regulator
MYWMKEVKPQDSNHPETLTAERSLAGELPLDPPKSDGRVNRSVTTRKKIVDALTALIYEGCLSPTAEQVAQRAHIGLRTVFRHFDDMDSLYREINSDLETLLVPVISVRLVGDSWQNRLMQSVELRSQLYDRIAAMHLAAQVHRHQSSFVADNLMRDVMRLREINRHILPASVQQNAVVFEALDLLMSPDTWIRLRRDQQLSADQALNVVRLGVKAVLATVAE